LEVKDFLLAPLFLLIIYTIAYIIRDKFIAVDDPTRKYFIIGLNLKVIGAFATGLIYWFYYGDGDTIYYFRRISYLNNLISRDLTTGLKVLFYSKSEMDLNLYSHLVRVRYNDSSYFKVVQIGTLLSLFSLKTYIGIALYFSFVSYLGLWLLYRVFYHYYPELYKQLAYAVLFIPSVVFWGSGLFKDTITIGCVAWSVYNVYSIFIKPKRRLINAFILIINIFLIASIKTYIVACLIPMLLVWVVLIFRGNIKSKFARISITPLLILATAGGGFLMTKQISSMSDTFRLDQLEQRALDMVWWHTQVKEIYGEEGGGGSFYSLGNPYDFSPMGIVKKVPQAINVTFFRPYLWEAGNPVMFMSALESLALFIFFGYLLLKLKINLFRRMFGNPFLVMCFGFALLFSVGVGITSSNFGALVRYKIPAMPFFVAGLTIIYFQMKQREEVKAAAKQLSINSVEES
jgi:hypothetical protein